MEHTAENIKKVVTDILFDYGNIEKFIAVTTDTVTTDNSTNVVKAIELLEFLHILCVRHTILTFITFDKVDNQKNHENYSCPKFVYSRCFVLSYDQPIIQQY